MEHLQNDFPFETVSLTTVFNTAGRSHVHRTSSGLGAFVVEAFVVEVVLPGVGLESDEEELEGPAFRELETGRDEDAIGVVEGAESPG